MLFTTRAYLTHRQIIATASYHQKFIKLLLNYRYSSGVSSESNQNYEDIYSKTNLVVPEYFNFAKDIIGKWVNKKGDATALWLTDGINSEQVSYSSLYTEAQSLATALSNPTPPRCAMVILPKVKEWWVINVAGSWCNTIISPGSIMLTSKDVKQRLEKYPFDCLICSAEIAERINDVTIDVAYRIVVEDPKNVRNGWINYHDLISSVNQNDIIKCASTKGNDVCQLFFTSGTTGLPKMVAHTQADYGIGLTISSQYWLDITEKDVLWSISDTGWVKAAWKGLYCPWLGGATAFVHKNPCFDPLEVARILSEYPVSVFCAPPTVYRALVQLDLTQFTFGALRHCAGGGEPINPEVIDTWEKHTGITIKEGYGQTESTLMCSNIRGMESRPGSMGKPTPGYILKILDDKLKEVKIGKEGHLGVDLSQGHPIGLFRRYEYNPEQTAKVFQGNYYFTGDKAYKDEDGYFWFVGRADDVIISAGYRIGPFEVESALLEHPAVVESAVVSSPDDIRGEVVKAFVVLSEEYMAADKSSLKQELQNHVKKTTAPYKYPRKIEFVSSLPKTISGKIRRVELREMEWKKV
ncbi:unnamed protein product [Meganyctiphanes norvegica]|uniref:medium-chain acyl-CoA ligase n=1 Tax=Meganyctiphanes norvegica TaxID=48144 RepID=A0AAV2SUR9_MEGNR